MATILTNIVGINQKLQHVQWLYASDFFVGHVLHSPDTPKLVPQQILDTFFFILWFSILVWVKFLCWLVKRKTSCMLFMYHFKFYEYGLQFNHLCRDLLFNWFWVMKSVSLEINKIEITNSNRVIISKLWSLVTCIIA